MMIWTISLSTKTPCENDDDDQNADFIEAANVDLTNESDKTLKKLLSGYEGIRNELERFCLSLPVFGFNSSRYDLNLIKE